MINRFCEVLYLSFERRPLALLGFLFKMFICAYHVRGSSITRPRYLVCVLGIIFWSLIRKFISFIICFLFDRKITFSVLSTFSEILFARIKCTISFKSWFTYLFICFRELLEYRRLESSAKWCITEC